MSALRNASESTARWLLAVPFFLAWALAALIAWTFGGVGRGARWVAGQSLNVAEFILS